MPNCGKTNAKLAKRILCSTFVYGSFEFIVKSNKYAEVAKTAQVKAHQERCALLELTINGLLDGGKPPRLTQKGIDFVLENYETFKDYDGRVIRLADEEPPIAEDPWNPKWGRPTYDSIV